MARTCVKIFIWVVPLMTHMLLSCSISGLSWWQLNSKERPKFKQKSDRFWEFDEKSKRWTEVKLPFDLKSCVNKNCTVVGSIVPMGNGEKSGESNLKLSDEEAAGAVESYDPALPLRRRISLTKMSEASIWVTGESGCIYERFWNGVQWVIAPHDLPMSAGFAVAVFIINQTILTLSEAGTLYQLQLGENSQPVWIDFMPNFGSDTGGTDKRQNSTMQIKSGSVTSDGESLYFVTMKGMLLELCELHASRWINHGRPPGGDVAAIADAAILRSDVVFTVSSTGELYEFDKSSKPSWKKHIRSEKSANEISLIPSPGFALHGLVGSNSLSLFLLAKDGNVMERRLHLRKWKWIIHKAPKGHNLTAITAAQNDPSEKIFSLFLTTANGCIFEYQLPKHSGPTNGDTSQESWVNHMHPPHAKAARGIPGLQLHVGRMIFLLDDGRIAELHYPGIGGETSGPTYQISTKRKSLSKYEWSVLDAPESEGWNAEYCSNERGPSNCIMGMNTLGDYEDENDVGLTSLTRRRKGQQCNQYLLPSVPGHGPTTSTQRSSLTMNDINANFRMRAMQAERSFFLITDGGVTFEYLYIENMWIWLRHDHSTAMKGVLGNYNGSLFLVDTYGSLLIRERNSDELSWINCTAMKKGRQVAVGPPWDGMLGKPQRVTAEDAMFFVTRNGRLLQFTVALRKFNWKDCRNPPNTKIASIIDQETFRSNIVFVTGRNGRLYQYNKLTELWHEHSQSPHLVLSRLPGTTMRPSPLSLTGSLFMFAENGGLIEYSWNTYDGWNWVEHGTPDRDVTLVGAPGPCYDDNQLFLIGSDGNVYIRYLEQRIWKWKSYGFPNITQAKDGSHTGPNGRTGKECRVEDAVSNFQKHVQSSNDWKRNCNEKVAPTRPIPFSEDSIIFELRDGRLAELRQTEDMQWEWSRTIGTPTSLCVENYWTAVAS